MQRWTWVSLKWKHMRALQGCVCDWSCLWRGMPASRSMIEGKKLTVIIIILIVHARLGLKHVIVRSRHD